MTTDIAPTIDEHGEEPVGGWVEQGPRYCHSGCPLTVDELGG